MATSYTNSIGTVSITEAALEHAPQREPLVIAAQAAVEHLPAGQGAEFKHGEHIFIAHRSTSSRTLVMISQPGGAAHTIRANAIAWAVEEIGTTEGEAAEEVLNTMSPDGLAAFHDNYCPDCR